MNEFESMILPAFTALIKRTSRTQSISIKIQDSQVIVNVPHTIKVKEIEALLLNKQSWVLKKLAESQVQHQRPVHRFLPGDTFLYLGHEYTLNYQHNSVIGVELNPPDITVKLHHREPQPKLIKYVLNQWYQVEALKIIKERCKLYQNKINKKPTSITIKNYRSRWGSCSIHGDIDFNWRLIMAPLKVIDYVVIHELAHLHHHNHSKQFWHLVAEIDPNYKIHKNWLKKYGYMLNFNECLMPA